MKMDALFESVLVLIAENAPSARRQHTNSTASVPKEKSGLNLMLL